MSKAKSADLTNFIYRTVVSRIHSNAVILTHSQNWTLFRHFLASQNQEVAFWRSSPWQLASVEHIQHLAHHHQMLLDSKSKYNWL